MGETSWPLGTNSVGERSSLPPRKGDGGEDRRPTIFARDRESGIDLLKRYLLRSNRPTAGATHSRRWVQRDS
jgi:hypothetical protein